MTPRQLLLAALAGANGDQMADDIYDLADFHIGDTDALGDEARRIIASLDEDATKIGGDKR